MSGLRVADPGAAVILITGIMASGKSTVAQGLAERLPRSVHVRGDVFRRMVVSGRAEMVPGAYEEAAARLRLRYRLSAMTADAYAGAGWTAVVQDVVLGEELAWYVELVRVRPLYVVVLAPGPRAVAGREAGRGTGWPTPIASAVGSRRRRHRHRRRHLRRRMCGNGCPCTAGAAISIARRP
ncbi:AAA family ATPase [Streptomyces sp. NPDC058357]|uniref:AAA family ATPase n=1 Tax=unclassified Streptomyces TaxID=2593676 RepID=UPI003655C426